MVEAIVGAAAIVTAFRGMRKSEAVPFQGAGRELTADRSASTGRITRDCCGNARATSVLVPSVLVLVGCGHVVEDVRPFPTIERQ